MPVPRVMLLYKPGVLRQVFVQVLLAEDALPFLLLTSCKNQTDFFKG